MPPVHSSISSRNILTSVRNAGSTTRAAALLQQNQIFEDVSTPRPTSVPGNSSSRLQNSAMNTSFTFTLSVDGAPSSELKIEASPQRKPCPSSGKKSAGPSDSSATLRDYSTIPAADGSSSKPLEQYLFPCEQPGPGKMRLAGQFDIWIPRNRLMDIESKHLTGKDWLLEMVEELLSLKCAQSKELLKKRSANGKGVTSLVSSGFLKAIKAYIRVEHEKANNPKFDDLKDTNVAKLLNGHLEMSY